MPRSAVVLIAALFIGGIGWAVATTTHHPVPAAPPVLMDLGPVPPFALTDQTGQPFRREDLLGHAWVTDFIFTRCAGQCPVMAARLQALAHRFPAASRLRLLSVSVDPTHDTPDVLAAYARQLGADSRQWHFLTGSQEAVFRLVREGFHLGVAEEGSAAEPVTHSVRLALIDAAGRIRGYYDATDPAAMAQLTRDVLACL